MLIVFRKVAFKELLAASSVQHLSLITQDINVSIEIHLHFCFVES